VKLTEHDARIPTKLSATTAIMALHTAAVARGAAAKFIVGDFALIHKCPSMGPPFRVRILEGFSIQFCGRPLYIVTTRDRESLDVYFISEYVLCALAR